MRARPTKAAIRYSTHLQRGDHGGANTVDAVVALKLVALVLQTHTPRREHSPREQPSPRRRARVTWLQLRPIGHMFSIPFRNSMKVPRLTGMSSVLKYYRRQALVHNPGGGVADHSHRA